MKLLSKFFTLGFVFFVSTVQAQDIVGMQEQIDAIKEEIVILQRKVYRDESVMSNPSQSEDYNQIVRSLNGKVDELEYKFKSLEEKINTINKDIDVRFRLLEGKPIPERPALKDRIAVAVEQFRLSEQDHGEHIACLEARKHFAWYLRGVAHSSYYKNQISSMNTMEDIYRIAKDIVRDLQ